MLKQKLKYKSLKPFREAVLQNQDYLCNLCNQPIEEGEAVLDHNHKTGEIRAVLHRGCNCLLGKIENNLTRNRISDEQLKTILQNAYDYIHLGSDFIHPTYKTPEEKKKKR